MTDKIHIDPQVREVVKLIREVLRHIAGYWYILVFFLILALVLGRVKKQPGQTEYIGNLSFIVNQSTSKDAQPEQGGVVSLITDFGLTGGTNVNAERLIELSKSNAVLGELLFQEFEVGGLMTYMANHYINEYMPNISDSTYFKNYVSLDSLSRGEYALVNQIINQMKNRHILFYMDKAQIFKVTTSTKKEELSKVLAEAFYYSLGDWYTMGTVAKAQANFEFAETRLEKSRKDLLDAEASLAGWRDRNRNLVFESAYLNENELERKVTIYQSVYASALQNFENAKVNLENQRPVFHLIDPPRYPLQRKTVGGRNITPFAIIGAIALYLLVTISLYFYKKYGYLLKELFEQ